jgi:hypothetical protein
MVVAAPVEFEIEAQAQVVRAAPLTAQFELQADGVQVGAPQREDAVPP